MAEAGPKHLPHDGGDPQNKRKKSTFARGSSSRKHPYKSSASKELEYEDTATSKLVIEVEMDNIVIMQEILEYRNRKGSFKCPDDLSRFCNNYIHLGIGNARGWCKKLVEIKNKFTIDSAPMDDADKKEFEWWKKIWGNERKVDDAGASS